MDGIPFIHATLPQLTATIVEEARLGEGGWVVTPNVDIAQRIRANATFAALVSRATVFTADGAPIIWASRILGTPLPGRLTGADLFAQLLPAATSQGLRVALIGGNPGAADAAADKLVPAAQRHLVACQCPPFGFESDPAEVERIRALIQDGKPHIVFIGLGSPKQEMLIERFRPLSPQSWWLGVGVSFSFVAGDVKRAPAALQRLGLEWLFRLVQEPGRLARRYLVVGIPAALGLLSRAFAQRYLQRSPKETS
ncbi:MAG TPA: WecB/TagA/CpsF family glycosyltransferase [Roseateles sp.]